MWVAAGWGIGLWRMPFSLCGTEARLGGFGRGPGINFASFRLLHAAISL